MPNDTSEDTQPTMCYPTTEQHGEWKDHADDLDMSLSNFVASMVEAGRKKFNASVSPDETNTELREQRNRYKRENDQLRRRVQRLEDRLATGERGQILAFIENNPGATYKEIVNHIGEKTPGRVTDHLDDLGGDAIEKRDDGYYRQDGGGE